MREDDIKSERKSSTLIECRRRKVCCVGGGDGVELIDSLVKIGKWSDGEQSEIDRDGVREESAEVMTRSRMWFLLWVGKFTCCVRLKDDRTDRNWDVAWIGAGVLASWLYAIGRTQKLAESLYANFCIFRGVYKIGNRIVMKFWTCVGVLDISTHANFGYDRFRGFWGAEVEFPTFLLTFAAILKTLALPC